MRTYVPPFSSSTLPIYQPTPYVNPRGFTEHHDIIFQNRLIRVCEWLHSCVFRYTFSSIIKFPCSYSFDYEFKTWVATSGLPVSQLNYLKIPYRPVALSLPSPHSGRTCCCTPALLRRPHVERGLRRQTQPVREVKNWIWLGICSIPISWHIWYNRQCER